MFLICELTIKSYIPLQLERGMLFFNAKREDDKLFVLEDIPENEDEFILENGYPVNLYIIDLRGAIIAQEDSIGWIENEDDEREEVTLEHLNTIINEYDSYLQVDMKDEGIWLENPLVSPILIDNKVVIRLLPDEEF